MRTGVAQSSNGKKEKKKREEKDSVYLPKRRNKILSIGRTSYIMLALFHYATHPLYHYLNRNCTLYSSNHRKKKIKK